ncbi:hypothetical protein DL95DRAFT_414432 [Leptodontidium sp. 2 PMI_412]|nr:hypothetical protein DL95DRAFT_414432 [Leptodontidium sp. 2 PMI_412]
MAADLLAEGKAGNDFMERSDLTLVGTGIDVRREITIEELMGGDLQYSELKEQLGNGIVLDYLTWFVQWMYTSKLEYKKDLRFFGMWIFASKIECPRLQKDAVRMLCRDALWRSNVSLEEKKRQYYFAHAHFANNLFYCDRRLRRALQANELLLVQMMKRMVIVAKEGGEICPWDPQNIARYFVAEPNSCDTLKEEPTLQAPLRKRRLYSSNVSVANDSHKRIRASSVPKATIDRDVTLQ